MTQAALFQLLPELAAEEYDELREDIRVNGVRVPVDIDEYGHILDGHHRVRIAAELGIDYETRVLSGLTDEQKRAHALAVNIHRRQLNREQKRELIRRSLAADPQLSDRQHAERTGTSHPTVASVRAGMEESGDVEKLSTRTDSTGRQQPAERQATEPVEIEGSEPLPVEFPVGHERAEAFMAGIDAVEGAPEPDATGLAATGKDMDPLERFKLAEEERKSREVFSKNLAQSIWLLAEFGGVDDATERAVEKWQPNQDFLPAKTTAARMRKAADYLYALAERWPR